MSLFGATTATQIEMPDRRCFRGHGQLRNIGKSLLVNLVHVQQVSEHDLKVLIASGGKARLSRPVLGWHAKIASKQGGLPYTHGRWVSRIAVEQLAGCISANHTAPLFIAILFPPLPCFSPTSSVPVASSAHYVQVPAEMVHLRNCGTPSM